MAFTLRIRRQSSSYIKKSDQICTTGLESRDVARAVGCRITETTENGCSTYGNIRHCVELVLVAMYGIRSLETCRKNVITNKFT